MNELVKMLSSQLNISDDQASGGLGSLMSVAQKFMGDDFSQISKALPGLTQTMSQAPEVSSGLGGMLGGVMSALGQEESSLAQMTKLASQFKGLGLEPSMIGQFLPVVIGYLKNSNNPQVADLVQKVASQFKI
jgi:Protein of unknown function VcgC/VcgE (DUF2780)